MLGLKKAILPFNKRIFEFQPKKERVVALYKFIYTPSLIIMYGDRRKFFFAVSLEILDKFLAICFFTYQCPEYFVKCFWPFPSSCGH